MTIEDIENGTFKPKEWTFNEGEMHFIVSIAFNYFSDMYADHGLEDGEECFQVFCNSVEEKFDETESGDIERVLNLIEELVEKRG
jgi:hypothetical protein